MAMPTMPMEAAKATSTVRAFLESRLDTERDRAVRKDMLGFFTRVRFLREAPSSASSGA